MRGRGNVRRRRHATYRRHTRTALIYAMLLSTSLTGLTPGTASAAGLHSITADGSLQFRASTTKPTPTPTLRMTPSQAMYDRARVYADGCHLHAKQTLQKTCLYGDRHGSKRTVLFGDSHAAQWFPAVATMAARRGYRLNSWTKSGCPWYRLTIVEARTGDKYPQCDVWRQSIMRRLTKYPPDVIVLAAIAGTYQVSNGGAVLSQSASQPAIEAAIADTLTTLVATGASVVVIADNPRRTDSIPLCIKAHLANPAACDIPRSSLRVSAASDAATAASIPSVAVADFTDRLCDASMCPVVSSGVIVFSDRNHLTATFTKSKASWFAEYLP